MAWRCTGSTNTELLLNMRKSEIIKSDRVFAAMTKVDRSKYVRNPSAAYQDSPQLIGHGATISAPHMHAYAAEHLLPYLHSNARVLDVGSGSGYLCAVLWQLLADDGHAGSEFTAKVVAIDHIDELVSWSVDNLRRDGLGREVDQGHIRVIAGDGRKGVPEDGPYDAIHVGAAAPTVPDALIEQLAAPGRMFIPVGTEKQQIMQIDKDAEGRVTEKAVLDVGYVPLTDREKQIASMRY
ncbi:Pcmt1-prov protein [Epithele typhae]|uniref:Pcmt1-prov protein n=1 Tax=Epithele typhae TaxID=378194 RepID=UPI0020087136|nr:Pcmt1-prov protein [Epithele typhae]KAH9941842.1 Pcmt1-prov protein [Epithele typhae]